MELYEYYGPHFDAQRTKDARGDLGVLRYNHVNKSVPAGSTHIDALELICSICTRPILVKRLSEKLTEYRYIRGATYFGEIGDIIADIVGNYPLLRWWLERDGLVVEEARSELGPLRHFDRLAGSLYLKHECDGKLPSAALDLIVKALDEESFKLKDHLQPAQWELISTFNQRNSRSPVKTFTEAVARPQFERMVRRRLYLARDRYKKALRPATPIYF